MGKSKKAKGGNTAKLGAPDHFTGFKLAFLVSRAAMYQQCLDSDTVTGFYDKVTLDFVAKYGQDEPFNKEFADDPPDPEDGIGDDEHDDAPLSKEETDRNAVLFTKLRTKLAQWYRRKYKRPEVTKATSSSANPFRAVLGDIGDNIGKAPRKRSAFHQYLKLYYISRVKEEYLRRYVVAKITWDDATQEDRDSGAIKKPIPVQLRTEVGKEFWLLETEEFRKEVAKNAEDTHSKEMAEWEELKKVPKTALQFHQQLAFAGQYLHPVAEAIAKQMQAAVSICIIGPVGDRNGEVEVRSVHVNWPGGLAAATWPSHDPTGYAEAEKSMCGYGRANFSAAECKRRALSAQVENNDNAGIEEPVLPGQVPDNTERARSASLPPPPLPPQPPTPVRTPVAQVPEPPFSSPVPTSLQSPAASHRALTPWDESPIPRQWRRVMDTAEPEPEAMATQNSALDIVPNVVPILQSSVANTANPPDSSLDIVPNVVPVLQPPVANTADPLDSSDWPQHMTDAYRYFTEETALADDVSTTNARNWGDQWSECLRNFVNFQRGAGFPDTGPSFPPATNLRPPEIGVWMKNRRPWKDMELADKEKFSQKWWTWWSSLQPDSRTCDDEPTIQMDWGKLSKAGKNGFLLIILSLVWWGKASNRDEGWLKAVVEVSKVLLCMRGMAGAIIGVKKTAGRVPLSGSNGANTAHAVSSKRRRVGDEVVEGSTTKRQRRR